VSLLLCGSAFSVMGRLLAGNAPLRGRASLELVVRPFDHRLAADYWRIKDPRLAVQTHAVVGGTAAYLWFVDGDVPDGKDDFDDWAVRRVLNSATPLFREARYLLDEEAEVRDPLSITRCRPQWQRVTERAGEVDAGVVADPARREQIEVDVVVFAPAEPGEPKRVLPLGEAKWGKAMGPGHVARLARARELLAAKGYDVRDTVLVRYSGVGFDAALRDEPDVQAIGLERLYG
jgi:hypothetical protein